MPCDSIETSKVDFKNGSPDFIRRALQSLGYSVDERYGVIHAERGYYETVTFQNGELTIRTRSGVDAAQITRAYSTQVVRFAAEEYGWQLEQTGENEFSAEKASF